MGALNAVPTTRLHVPWVVPVVFVVTAGLGLLSFRVSFPHQQVLVAVALGFAAFSSFFAAAPHNPRLNAAYFGLELAVISVITWASGGARSPLLGLYLVFILECSMAYAQPWGMVSALAAAISVEVSQLALNGWVFLPNASSELDLSRLAASYAFFSLAGLLTSVQSGLMKRRQEQQARDHAFHQSQAAMEQFQMSVAREIQQTMLPLDKPVTDHWDCHWLVRPQQMVGGDLVQFFDAGNALGCALADVTGKGVSAALLTGSLHQMVLRYAHLSPETAMSKINKLLVDSTPTALSVSMLIVKLLPDGDVLYANAGHPYPLAVRAQDGHVEPWLSNNLLAGLWCDVEYTLHRRHLDPGDTLLLYTDGLSDIRRTETDRLDDDGVAAILQKAGGQPLETLATRLLEPLETGRQVDDITMLLVRRLAPVAPQATRSQALSPGPRSC